MTTLFGTVRLPRARRVRVGCVAVLVAVTAVATACGSSSKSTNSTNSTSTSTSVPKPTAQPASPDGVGSTDPALADPVGTLIIRDVPMEFSLQDDDLAGTGPTDLDKAAGFDGAKRFLEEAGFEREYQRIWTTNNFGSTIYIRIAEFAARNGAQLYCSRLAEIVRAKTSTPEAFAVDGVPSAIGVRGTDRDGSASAVFAVKDKRCVEVLWGGTNDVPAAEQIRKATELFNRQYAAL